MKTAKLLATNTLAQLVGKAATIGSTLLIGRMISSPDGIGKAGFDEYAIIVAYAAYFYIVTDFGFNAIAAQKVTEDESQASRYISNLLSMRLVLSVGLIMVALAALAFISYSTTVKLGILILLVTIATQAIFTNGNILFQAKLRYVQSTIAVASGAATSLALAYLVFVAGGNIFGYLVAIVIGSATMAAVSLFQVGSAVKIRPAFDFTLWRHVVLAALPLGLTIVFNLIYVRSGFFILSVTNEASYGIYTMAYRIFDAVLVLPVFVVNALYPIMIKRLQQGRTEFKALFRRSVLGMLAASAVVAIAVWVFAPLAIWLSTSNPAFEPAVQALRWLSLLTPLFFVSNILLWAIITLGYRKSLVIIYAIGAVISLSLNLWLIPQYGYVAAIIVTAIAEGVILVLMAAQLYMIFQRDAELPADSRGEYSLNPDNQAKIAPEVTS